MTEFLGRLFSPLVGLISEILELFHSLGAPWWLSIVLLTVSVRAVLFPLTVRQVRNMRTMQELKPEVNEIRSRYKDDRQKQQEAMMELYRERQVNPLASFLPILVQVPVFVTMYQVVRSHEETFPSFASGGLLWFSDLTRPDPYFLLPVLSASLLVVAGEVAARNVDPQQRRLMRFMPVALTALIARFPAGLFVYWVTSNTVTLTQNVLIYRFGPHKPLPLNYEQAQVGPTQECAESVSANNLDLAKSMANPSKKKAAGARRNRKKRKR